MKFLSTLVANILGTFIAFAILLFIGFLFVIALVASGDQTPAIRSGSVLVVDLEGSVPERVSGDPLSQLVSGEAAYGLHDLTHAIEEAATDDRIAGLWIKPGMVTSSWASLERIRRSLDAFKASGKPVYGSSRSYYTRENEFYLLSAADRIFLDPEAVFEYNGFDMQVTFYRDLLERWNVEPIIIRSGTFKGAVEPFLRDDLSPENELQLQTLVDGIEAVFLDGVSVGRGIPVKDLSAIMDNDIVFGADQALAAGLVDTLAYDADVRAAFNRALGNEADERLPTVSIRNYARAAPLVAAASGSVAVVHVSGNMIAEPPEHTLPIGQGQVASAGAVVDAIRAATRASSTRAIVLRIDSPGGLAPAADAMLAALNDVDSDIPIVVSMGDVAASGGYWLATGGDMIMAEASTITGSIGVFMMLFNLDPFLSEKIGIHTDGVTSAPHADMITGVTSLSDAQRRALQSFADDTYARFLGRVAQSRDMSIDEVDALAQGRIWLGRDAVENGLVDALGGLEEAIDEAASRAGIDPSELSVAHYPKPRTFTEELLASMGGIRAKSVSARDLPEPFASQLRVLQLFGNAPRVPQAVMPFTLDVR
ncbi:MAG: signal peptide peptidase SppA [Bacteroidetes bacterium CG12_big_fil_rev_8_21_14_0_65_60_17]|nr:MAG: signal peptide peptidase SppA [Bacteroidetes bacterium CG12_big_fil_rev_8_21_14_0_65_60_17]